MTATLEITVVSLAFNGLASSPAQTGALIDTHRNDQMRTFGKGACPQTKEKPTLLTLICQASPTAFLLLKLYNVQYFVMVVSANICIRI